MFTKTYFEHADPGSAATQLISKLAQDLWDSIDWQHMLCDGKRVSVNGTGE
jgi:hypothetical protein